MQKKNRSISKGVIEAKDKQDVSKISSSQQSQHFSPNVSKRNVGVNLNTFLNSKPGVGVIKEEVDLGQSDSHYKNTNYNIGGFHVNQSMSTNNSNYNGTTSYQKYTKNTTINLAKSQIVDKNQQYSGVNSSMNNTNSNFVNPLPQKNMKLESIKNINTVIRKLKTNNTNSKMITGGPSSKPDLQKLSSGASSYQKKQGIPSLHNSNLLNASTNKRISNNMNSTSYPSQLIAQNLVDISPSTSLANMNINDMHSSKTQTSSLSNLTNTNSKNGVSGLTHNNHNHINLSPNLGDGFGKSTGNQIYTNSAQKNLFKPQLDDINLINNTSSKQIKVNNTGGYDKSSDNKKSTQETKDNSSNSSTIKNYKHSNSNSLNTMQVQANSQINQAANIENPEDLHFFYVKMFQTNKEFAYKFEKEEN